MYKIGKWLFVTSLLSLLLFSCNGRPKQQSEEKSYVKPDEDRFTIEVLTTNVNQPMQLIPLDDGRVIFIEKVGKIKVFDPKDNSTTVIGDIPVNLYYSEEFTTAGGRYDADDGLHGIALDPNFKNNHFVYLYYSPEGDDPKSVLARYTLKDDRIDPNSQIILLEWRTQRNRCCHFGGGMVFDANGNLLVAIGDNTALGTAPEDAPRKEVYDPQRTAGNSNDLRGSILRIHPEEDGSYTIPEGNIFSVGIENARPEIYIMGVRNPMRLNIDSNTGWLYWGEVGPSTDEFNLAKEAGQFGWPYFIADNEPEIGIDSLGNKANPNRIKNTSPLNTGIEELPSSPVPALIWYDRSISDSFPIPGTGSLSAIGGPVYRQNDFENPQRPFPAYYEGKWFVTDFVRGWILVVETDDEGNYLSMEHFLPNVLFKGPIDMKFGADGDLYVLEYSREPYVESPPDARLIRIKYNDGNRVPVANAEISQRGGPIPFELELFGDESYDPDEDQLSFLWDISSDNGYHNVANTSNPALFITEVGNYQAKLIVSDAGGLKDSTHVTFVAGNSPPEVEVQILSGGNKSVYLEESTVKFDISIKDFEDNKLASGLNSENINVWSGVLIPEYDINEDQIKSYLDSATSQLLPIEGIAGKNILNKSDCSTCHQKSSTSVGPAYSRIVSKYDKYSNTDIDYLSNKIRFGGSGVWGSVEMPPHPALSERDADLILKYIFSINSSEDERLPMSGTLEAPAKAGDKLLIYASYLDSGNDGVLPIKTSEMVIMRNNEIAITKIDAVDNMDMRFPGYNEPFIVPTDSISHIKIASLDLSGITKIQLNMANIDIEQLWDIMIRINSPKGEEIGKYSVTESDSKKESVIEIPVKDINTRQDLFIIFHSRFFDSKDPINIKTVTMK